MKKLFLFLAITAFGFISCSDDDDSTKTKDDSIDLIIGMWDYTSLEGEEELPECYKKINFEFNKDNTYIFRDYELKGDECSQAKDAIGNWKNIGNRQYKLTLNNKNLIITLSKDNKTFTQGEGEDIHTYTKK